MLIITDVDGSIVIRKAYVGPIFETDEGNRYGICMRDDTIEIIVIDDAPAPRIVHFGVDLGPFTEV